MRIHVNNNKDKKIIFFLFSILFSLISALSVTAILLTDGSIKTFNNNGIICDVDENTLISYDSNIDFNPESNLYTVIYPTLPVYIATNHSDYRWNYIDCIISNLSGNSTNCFISYYNSTGQLVGSSSASLENGRNLIATANCAFSKIEIKPYSEGYLLYSINDIHFRKQLPIYTTGKFLCYSIIFFIVFLCICFAFCYLRSKYDLFCEKKFITKLINGYHFIYEYFYHSISKTHTLFLQVIILCILFIFLNFVNLNNLFFDKQYHRSIIIALCFFLLALIMFSIPHSKPNKTVDWNNPLVLSYFIFWFMTCISDFIVPKLLPFYGYIMIFLMGFLFFIWSKSDSEDIAHVLCTSIEIVYLLSVVYCFLFQPYTGTRYNGAYNNPNPYAFFLTIVGIVIACQLEYYLKNTSLHMGILLRYICELCSLIYFLFLTQSVTATLALSVAAIFWLLRNFKYITSYYQHRLLHIAIVFLICMPVISIVSHWILLHVSPYLAPTYSAFITSQQENPFFSFTTTVNAATTESTFQSTRITEKLFHSTSFNDLLSGRNYFYTFYLRNMNLFGHYYRPTMYGFNNAAGSYAHNGFLSVAYSYGVYTVIPYFFMLFYYGKYAFRYYKYNKNTQYAFFPLGIFIVFFIENLSDNVDTPFHWIIWFIFTFTMGILFQNSKSSQS